MNIEDKSQKRNCTSCQMCGGVCPVDAIKIVLDKSGFYRPTVNKDKCINCGMCVRVCYKFDENIEITEDFSTKLLYAAWSKNSDVVKNTTSGGIADVLARKLISEGYTCIGVGYDTKTNSAIGVSASSLEDLSAFRGSKYIQSYSVETFKSLVKNHKKQKFAVFGLPCQIYGIDKYLKFLGCRNEHLLIDMYCHGCPSINLWHKYIDEILKKYNGSNVISVNFRSKIKGWGNFYVVVVVEGKPYPIEVISSKTRDPFYTLFFSDSILNDSCSDCKLRSTLEYTDIRLGDFWGDRYVKNSKGVSAVTICSKEGFLVYSSILSDIVSNEENLNDFLKYQSYGKIYHINTSVREKLLEELSDNSHTLNDAVKTYYQSLGLKKKIILECKNVMKILPPGLLSSIKGLFYKIR